ncbi:MAG: DUF2523 domain-containing protein [Magnetococcales bacterium]|nr:DUF2523 domain-containing protein [Magnetococcales bacterium]
MDFKTAISNSLQSIYNFFESIYLFLFDGGISEWVGKVISYFYEVLMVLYYSLIKIVLTGLVAFIDGLYESMNIAGAVEGYWQNIDEGYRGIMVFFHVPLILSMLLSAFVLRKILKYTEIF